jgi:hypothetical protein
MVNINMREKVERGGSKEWGEGEGRVQRRKGFVHRLGQETTSYFFTNFPEEAKVTGLWSKFARFGRVGEVYVLKKLDKQGQRFGFVKFREVRDEGDLLSRMGDIWIGTFKLRVNLSRFNRNDKKLEVKEDVPEASRTTEARRVPGVSFKAALMDDGVHRGKDSVVEGDGRSKPEVVWEVEVEEESVAKIKGAYVGFLVKHKESSDIQQNFMLDGYQNLKVTPLGHLRVLISSLVEGQVKEVLGSVGWWCSWFERIEEWSPNLVSNQRVVWLKCYGVPLHAWGNAIFRCVAFKFRLFADVDHETRNMLRGDMARIKIVTNKLSVIDFSMVVSVLGKKFVIRVMEEVWAMDVNGESKGCRCQMRREITSSKGSMDGGSVVAGSEEGNDDGWSKNGHVLLGGGAT